MHGDGTVECWLEGSECRPRSLQSGQVGRVVFFVQEELELAIDLVRRSLQRADCCVLARADALDCFRVARDLSLKLFAALRGAGQKR